MSVPPSKQRRAAFWGSRWVLAVLAVSSALAARIGAREALSLQDAEALESPLLLSVARQLFTSPWDLYGPYGGRNPLVLIHAPLYYHLAALLAWTTARTGLEPVTAALVAGRSLSLMGLAVTLTAVYRLARLDGAPARAGWLAVCLFACAPVVGAMPFSVRPDMMGVALQATGVLLVLSVWRSQRPGAPTLHAAFALFGLAICVKQHLLVGPLISTCLLLVAGRRGQVARVLLTALTIVVVVYGTEELATGGRMSQSVFVAAANAASVHRADATNAMTVLMAIIGQSAGLIVILAASGLAMVPVNPNLGRRAFAAAGTGLVGLILVLMTLQLVVTARWQSVSGWLAIAAALFIVVPLCAVLEPTSMGRGRLDQALWLYLAAELALLVVLCRSSTGAWVNYAIPATVFVSVLTARALDRALSEALAPGRLLPIALAVSIVPFGVVLGPYHRAKQHHTERFEIARIFRETGRPPSEFFFVGRPGDNRVNGRLDLVYDDWLYPVFESIHLAEPRSMWLRRALTAGSVRFVVNNSDGQDVDGIGQSLPLLGYSRRFQIGPFFVWERVLPPASLTRGRDQGLPSGLPLEQPGVETQRQ